MTELAKQERTTCKISTFFEDLSFLNPKSHLIKLNAIGFSKKNSKKLTLAWL